MFLRLYIAAERFYTMRETTGFSQLASCKTLANTTGAVSSSFYTSQRWITVQVMSKATAWRARASAARSPGMVLCCSTAAGMLCAVALLINILRFFHLTGGN